MSCSVKHLVLDAGPLLSLSPLRGIAENYYTVPLVVAELKDARAREYFEKLATAGVHVQVRSPDVESVAHVTRIAKQTGDLSVLSQADICILALTHALSQSFQRDIAQLPSESRSDTTLVPQKKSSEASSTNTGIPLLAETNDKELEADDGEGEWIMPSNVSLRKSKALLLIPDISDDSSVKDTKQVIVGCMTADFAMQNVVLQMDMVLVNVTGQRIRSVKSWILRCHACFKLCRDMSKKFCPSCGNATLLRASVSVSSNSNSSGNPMMKVHLKKNFQYKNRGTQYSIPLPKPGSSKTGTGEGQILREDQIEWVRAEKREKSRQAKAEKQLVQALQMANLADGEHVRIGAWTDPDWVPEMLSVGVDGKGRNGGGGMPDIGFGRKNPNEKRRRR